MTILIRYLISTILSIPNPEKFDRINTLIRKKSEERDSRSLPCIIN